MPRKRTVENTNWVMGMDLSKGAKPVRPQPLRRPLSRRPLKNGGNNVIYRGEENDPMKLRWTFEPRHDSDEDFRVIEKFFTTCGFEYPQPPLSWEFILATLKVGDGFVPDDVIVAVFRHTPQLILKVELQQLPAGIDIFYVRVAEIAIKSAPMLLERIEEQWPQLCEIAVSENPNALRFVKDKTATVCDIAMSKDASIYRVLPQEHRTYAYYTAYKKYEHVYAQVLEKAYETVGQVKIPKINREFGIEIEFVVETDVDEVFCLLKDIVNLDTNIGMGGTFTKFDKSLWRLVTDSTTKNMYEIQSCILNDESAYLLHKVTKVLVALEQFKRIKITNDCGLHVHLSAHDLSFQEVIQIVTLYKNYTTVIQKLLSNTRAGNRHCETPISRQIEKWQRDEYLLNKMPTRELKSAKSYTVNPLSYFYYNTIEFRQHESTIDFYEIMYWVYIVANMINNRGNSTRGFLLGDLFELVCMPKSLEDFYITKYNSIPS
jgi:hypothetical protein